MPSSNCLFRLHPAFRDGRVDYIRCRCQIVNSYSVWCVFSYGLCQNRCVNAIACHRWSADLNPKNSPPATSKMGSVPPAHFDCRGSLLDCSVDMRVYVRSGLFLSQSDFFDAHDWPSALVRGACGIYRSARNVEGASIAKTNRWSPRYQGPPKSPRGLVAPSRLRGGAGSAAPSVGLPDPGLELDPWLPAQRRQLGNFEELSRGSVGL